MQQARQAGRRTRHAVQAAACQACRGQVGRTPLPAHSPGHAHSWKSVAASSSSRSLSDPRGRGVWNGSQAASAHSGAFPLAKSKVQV